MKLFYLIGIEFNLIYINSINLIILYLVFFNCLINITVAKSRCARQCEKSPRKPVCAIMPNGKSKTFMNKCAMEQQACLKYVGMYQSSKKNQFNLLMLIIVFHSVHSSGL